MAGDALGHDWIEANCIDPLTCRNCGETEGDALGHAADNWSVMTESSCTQTGFEEGICMVCGETIQRELALAEHTSGDWVVTVEPTIDNNQGVRVKSCEVCEAILETENFTLTAEEIEEYYKEKCKKIPSRNVRRYILLRTVPAIFRLS